ncbi:hypothetical protein SEVIR_1G381150v4 [Setaria viridis]
MKKLSHELAEQLHLGQEDCRLNWPRSGGHPNAGHCPVCKAAVPEGRLLPLYGRRAPSFGTADPRRNGGGGHNERRLRFDVRPTGALNNLHGHHYGDHWGWVLHSNAGCLIRRAFLAEQLSSLPPRPVIVCDGQRRIKRSDMALPCRHRAALLSPLLKYAIHVLRCCFNSFTCNN